MPVKTVGVAATANANASAAVALTGCTVSVTSATEVLTLGMDESYTLHIDAGPQPTCTITAGTSFVFRARALDRAVVAIVLWFVCTQETDEDES